MTSNRFTGTDGFPVLEPALSAVVAKLGENQPRLREKAVDVLASLSHCDIVGANRVAEKVMWSLERKRPPSNKWRPIATRLEFLKRLAIDFGVVNSEVAAKAGSRALKLESIINFIETHGCTSHTFEEVRAAAKNLVVVLFVIAPTADRSRLLDPFLAKLRPKQAREYHSAINQGLDNRYDHLEISARPGEAVVSPRPGPVPAQQQATDTFKPLYLADSNVLSTPESTASIPCHHAHRGGYPKDDESQRSEDVEEELFRDQIMKQLEEKAFSVQEAYEILRMHFSSTAQKNPTKEAVLAEWVKEVGTDLGDDGKLTRDKKLWKVATWLFQ